LLSSCEPRDIQHLPDSARQGRNSRGGGSDTRKASLTLYDFARLQHMVDRQLEAVSVLELYIQAKERNSQELAEELGFEILNGNRHLGLARYGFVENGGQEKISSDDAWNFDNSQWMASGYADRKLILNNEDSTLLHMSEDKKKLVIKKV